MHPHRIERGGVAGAAKTLHKIRVVISDGKIIHPHAVRFGHAGGAHHSRRLAGGFLSIPPTAAQTSSRLRCDIRMPP